MDNLKHCIYLHLKRAGERIQVEPLEHKRLIVEKLFKRANPIQTQRSTLLHLQPMNT